MAQGNAPRLRRREPRRYIGTDMLKIIGLLLRVQGTVGVALLQNGLLNMGVQTRLELWDLIQTDQNAAQVLAWSVLSKGMVSLAWPIFAYLAVEGLQNTSSFPRYALRLLITALVSEVPYDLAMSGKWVDWSSQNFLFSLLIGLVALYMVQEVAEARENGRALQVLFPVGAVLWTFLFQTQLGILVVLAMTAMYFLRERPLWRDILVAVLGLATIPASLSVLLIHFHRPGPTMFPKWIYYAAYPIQLLAIGLIGYFLL